MDEKATMMQRMMREIAMMDSDPPPGICCYPKGDQISELEGVILGAVGTPYENGVFKLDISIPDRYPFEPPKVKFLTKIYHPNIDHAGRICLDTLKEGKNGAWKPSQNIKSLLLTIQILLSHPNPDDPLVAEISAQFRDNYAEFAEKARAYTKLYATNDQTQKQEIQPDPLIETVQSPTSAPVKEEPKDRLKLSLSKSKKPQTTVTPATTSEATTTKQIKELPLEKSPTPKQTPSNPEKEQDSNERQIIKAKLSEERPIAKQEPQKKKLMLSKPPKK